MIKTRFAPSPTGKLHIGGVRTALFNYLFAKKEGGCFLLRIEDTDKKRSKKEFVVNIIENLVWLNIIPDNINCFEEENNLFQQKNRLEIYKKYIFFLVEKKKAYYCFCSEEELKKEKGQKLDYKYSRKCLFLSEEEVKIKKEQKKSFVIRFLVNQKEEYNFEDILRGTIKSEGKDIEDFIIFRSDGTPLFLLTVVVDDYLMNITHVIRSEEHITNTHKQIALYLAFEWKIPKFVHIPIVLNQQKKKISKRNDEQNINFIDELRKKGYLAESIINHLAFLGWHPGAGIKNEFFSLKQLEKIFSFSNLQRRSAVYEKSKLDWYNRYYLKQMSKKKFFEESIKFLLPVYKNFKDFSSTKIFNLISDLREQICCFSDLVDMTKFFFVSPDKTFLISIKKEIGEKTEKIKILFEKIKFIKEWKEKKIEEFLNLWLKENSLFKKDFFPLIRKIISMEENGPHLSKIFFYLGKKEVLKRLNL